MESVCVYVMSIIVVIIYNKQRGQLERNENALQYDDIKGNFIELLHQYLLPVRLQMRRLYAKILTTSKVISPLKTYEQQQKQLNTLGLR